MNPVRKALAEVCDLAAELAAAVHKDDQGEMVGMERMGGNGGLLSNATIAKADAVQLKIAEVEALLLYPEQTGGDAS